MMETGGELVILLLVIMMILDICLIFIAIWLRSRTEYRNQLVEREKVRWDQLVENGLESGEFPEIKVEAREEFLDYLVEKYEEERPEKLEKIGQLLVVLGIDKTIAKKLKQGAYNKALAVYYIGLFRLRQYRDQLETLLYHKSNLLNFVATQALVRLTEPGTAEFRRLVSFILGRYQIWTVEKLAELLMEMGQPAGMVLVEMLAAQQIKGRMLRLIIDILGEMRLEAAGPELLKLLDRDKETVIRTIRALGQINYQPSLSVLLALAKSPEWEIRAQVARALAQLRVPEIIPVLKELTRDPSWWVRHNAAIAISRQIVGGDKILQEIATSDEDRYAAEMAWLVLAQMEGNAVALV